MTRPAALLLAFAVALLPLLPPASARAFSWDDAATYLYPYDDWSNYGYEDDMEDSYYYDDYVYADDYSEGPAMYGDAAEASWPYGGDPYYGMDAGEPGTAADYGYDGGYGGTADGTYSYDDYGGSWGDMYDGYDYDSYGSDGYDAGMMYDDPGYGDGWSAAGDGSYDIALVGDDWSAGDSDGYLSDYMADMVGQRYPEARFDDYAIEETAYDEVVDEQVIQEVTASQPDAVVYAAGPWEAYQGLSDDALVRRYRDRLDSLAAPGRRVVVVPVPPVGWDGTWQVSPADRDRFNRALFQAYQESGYRQQMRLADYYPYVRQPAGGVGALLGTRQHASSGCAAAAAAAVQAL